MERIDRRRDALDRACLGKKGAVLTTKSYVRRRAEVAAARAGAALSRLN